MSEQARAARLTAIAARLKACAELKDELRQAASQCVFEVQTETWYGAAGNLFGRAADGLATLSAHVETLTQQVAGLADDKQHHIKVITDLAAENDSLEQQRDAAHAALEKYGCHTANCAVVAWLDAQPLILQKERPACTCGLDAALAASAPPAPAQETERGR